MKRFYKSVTLGEKTDAGYQLLLDNKPVRTPDRKIFFIPSKTLADLIVKEWEDQKENVLPLTMPVCQMTMTLIDRVIPNRVHLEEEMLGYIDTDLICYRADEPEQYKKAQEAKWDPFIDWFEQAFKLRLEVTNGLVPLTQISAIHTALADHVATLSDNQLMAMYLATMGTGSIILATAFQMRAFPDETILSAAFAEELLKDEIYLGHIYGSAPDQEKKYKSLSNDLQTLVHFLT